MFVVFVRCVRDRDKGRCVQWVRYTSARGGGGRVGWLGFVSIRYEAWLNRERGKSFVAIDEQRERYKTESVAQCSRWLGLLRRKAAQLLAESRQGSCKPKLNLRHARTEHQSSVE